MIKSRCSLLFIGAPCFSQGGCDLNKPYDNDRKSNRNEILQALTLFSQLGIRLAATVFVGVLIGKYLDRLLGTAPWLLLIFSLLGAAAAMKVLFDFVNKEEQKP
jgi:ATP synthase protein I